MELDQVLLSASGTKGPHASVALQVQTKSFFFLVDNIFFKAAVGGSQEQKNREIYLYFRPGLDSFLESAASICEIMVYTSGNKKVRNLSLTHCFINKLVLRISHRYHRQKQTHFQMVLP